MITPEALPFCRADGRDQVLPGLGRVLRHWQEHCGGLTSQSRKGEDHSGGTASRRHHLSDLNEEAGGWSMRGDLQSSDTVTLSATKQPRKRGR